MADLSGRKALVTGGGRGIGRGICVQLARAGADVAVNYHSNDAAAAEVAEQVRALGRQAVTIRGDVSKYEECGAITQQAVDAFGYIDILVNNAGVGATALGRPIITETKPEDFEWLMATHAWGSFYMCQQLLPQMRERERGDVIMISSVAAQTWGATGGTYNAAKSAMEALAHTLAKEERQHGIRVNIVAPGLVETDMGETLVKFTRGVDSIKELAERQPFGFLCQPEDIANAVVFLATEEGRYVTNQRITVSGGGF
ncbi:MAG: SDR family oxidoreductase [Dehalococcoidia bacterium]|nr:SDR family oxidoreductase [Dehalococcoidia bacterium]